MPLFDKVAYHISKSIHEHTRRELGRILDANGAADVPLERATHVVSDTIDFEGASAQQKSAACVTPYWVERSMELGVLQDPKYFSADRDLIFSGVVATSAGIPPGDTEVIIAGIKECGGQWRQGLTRDVTHLFVTNTSSQKYETAMHFRDSAHIIILLPQWFDQCWSMQMRLPHKVFEFPNPPYLRRDDDLEGYQAQMLTKRTTAEAHDKRVMLRTMDDAPPAPAPAARDIWQRRLILLSSALGLDAARRASVEDRIRRHGGVVLTPADDDPEELAAVAQAEVLVTQHRTGKAYASALAAGKTIGTLAWLFCVEHSGVVSSPRDRLLHFPVRPDPIEGFRYHVITVTNYQGQERDYLKKLIELMGATFTPTMSGRNTVVVAAYKGGNKTSKAEDWSLPIVTHKWLEDCFVEWRNLTPAQKKYLDYAPGVNYGTVLGDRGVGLVRVEDLELLPEDTRVSVPQDEERAPKEVTQKKADLGEPRKGSLGKSSTAELPMGTANSAREAREVEEVENVLNVEENAEPVREEEEEEDAQETFTPMKVGPPRGVKKTPAKPESPKLKSAFRYKPASIKEKSEDLPSHKGKEKENPSPKETHVTGEEAAQHKLKLLKEGGDSTMPQKPRPKPRPAFSKKIMPENGNGSEADVDVPTVVEKLASHKEFAHDAGGTSEPEPKPKPRPGKEKAREITPANVNSDEEIKVLGRVEETPPRAVTRSPRKYQSSVKTKWKAAGTLPSDGETVNDRKETHAKKLSSEANEVKYKRGVNPSPTRMFSIELPDPRSLVKSLSMTSHPRTPERRNSDARSKTDSSPMKSSPMTRRSSIRATAYEASSLQSPKRGRPSKKRDVDTRRSPTSSPPRRADARSLKRNVSDTSRSTVTPPPIQRTPSRRWAAAAATQRLHNEVMPDMNNFENETRRRGRRKRKTSSTVGFEGDEDEESESEGDIRGRKKKKVAATTKRKNASSIQDDEESDAPPAKFVTHVRFKRSAPTDDEDDSEQSRRHSQSGARKKVHSDASPSDDGSGDEAEPRRSSCDPKKIYILTTKVELRDEICKPLMKLGVKFTEKPEQCTHLVAISFARTEKFLCALSNAPYVLNTNWLLESSAKKMILAESDYFLKDAAMEEKHNFKLADALKRARELKKRKEKLFQGHFFFFTANVPVDFDLMKKVIQANGAQCIKKMPTLRNLSATRHIVSTEKDEKLWRPIAKQGFPIFSAELILTAACAQFVDWDGKSKRVPGSF